MTVDDCIKGAVCSQLGKMNTRNGVVYCCRYFYPPEALENVECEQTSYGFGIVVNPRKKRKNGKQG